MCGRNIRNGITEHFNFGFLQNLNSAISILQWKSAAKGGYIQTCKKHYYLVEYNLKHLLCTTYLRDGEYLNMHQAYVPNDANHHDNTMALLPTMSLPRYSFHGNSTASHICATTGLSVRRSEIVQPGRVESRLWLGLSL